MSKKKNQLKVKQETKRTRSAFNLKITAAALGIILLLVLIHSLTPEGSDRWSVRKDGVLAYPEDRGRVDVNVLKTESGSNYTLETISFTSKDYTVEGLLRVPLSGKKVPAVVILPGANVPKEGTQGLAELFSNLGYASLGIEQRNRGVVDIRNDYELFKENKEPVEHKIVFDALRAVDVLKQDERVDPERIAIVGESNGGRFATIAAAIDPSISGVIGISTSGYDAESEAANIMDETLFKFYRSVDPDTYLGFIPPRRFVMMHSVNDSVIPIDLAERTFRKASEPKQFYRIEAGRHGFSEGMRVPLENELKLMLQ
ncbi:MAG: acetylxylan esterase [Candidatus Methanoperedens sp.]|nr:acetylxylan esterase [Candidatus Methanoperedens sp.]